MLLDSENIIKTKKHMEVMQAFLDEKEIEYRKKFAYAFRQCTAPTWDFNNYEYRIKPSEPEYVYPIYKQSIEHGTIIKFTGLDSGEYMTKTSSFNIGDYNNNLVEHTDNTFWKDYDPSIDISSEPVERERSVPFFHKSSAEELVYLGMKLPDYVTEQLSDFELEGLARKVKKQNTIELFEVIVYCDILKEFSIQKILYSQEELEFKQNAYKTGRSFIVNKDTKQIIKIVNI